MKLIVGGASELFLHHESHLGLIQETSSMCTLFSVLFSSSSVYRILSYFPCYVLESHSKFLCLFDFIFSASYMISFSIHTVCILHDFIYYTSYMISFFHLISALYTSWTYIIYLLSVIYALYTSWTYTIFLISFISAFLHTMGMYNLSVFIYLCFIHIMDMYNLSSFI